MSNAATNEQSERQTRAFDVLCEPPRDATEAAMQAELREIRGEIETGLPAGDPRFQQLAERHNELLELLLRHREHHTN